MRHAPVLGIVCLAALGIAPVAAHADGPCTNDIAQLRRQLADVPSLGAPVSEPGAGQTVGRETARNDTGTNGAGTSGASSAGQHSSGGASLAAGGSPGTVGGAAGAVGAAAGQSSQNAVASGQVATSAEDVRRQSEGKPTMAAQAAQQASSGGAGSGAATVNTTASDKASQAKAALQRAVDLNAQNDDSCHKAINDARQLAPQR